MKKILLLLFLLPIIVGAVALDNPLQFDTFEGLIVRIIHVLFNLAIMFLPIMIVIGAFYWVGSSWELLGKTPAANIETGKNIIKYSIIGFIVIIMARGFVYFLWERFELEEYNPGTQNEKLEGYGRPIQ